MCIGYCGHRINYHLKYVICGTVSLLPTYNRCVLPELVKDDCVTIPFCRKLLMMADFPTALPPNILTVYLVGSLHLLLSNFLSFVYPGGDFSDSGQREVSLTYVGPRFNLPPDCMAKLRTTILP